MFYDDGDSSRIILTNQNTTYNPGHLVASTINNHRKDFRTPFLEGKSTFG